MWLRKFNGDKSLKFGLNFWSPSGLWRALVPKRSNIYNQKPQINSRALRQVYIFSNVMQFGPLYSKNPDNYAPTFYRKMRLEIW